MAAGTLRQIVNDRQHSRCIVKRESEHSLSLHGLQRTSPSNSTHHTIFTFNTLGNTITHPYNRPSVPSAPLVPLNSTTGAPGEAASVNARARIRTKRVACNSLPGVSLFLGAARGPGSLLPFVLGRGVWPRASWSIDAPHVRQTRCTTPWTGDAADAYSSTTPAYQAQLG